MDRYLSPPSLEENGTTQQLPSRTTYGHTLSFSSAAVRARSINMQVDDSAAAAVYVLAFDAPGVGAQGKPLGPNGIEIADGTIPLLRTDLLQPGEQAWFRETATRDAVLGGFPFDLGLVLVACVTPEYVTANVRAVLNATARLQLGPYTPPCAPAPWQPTQQPYSSREPLQTDRSAPVQFRESAVDDRQQPPLQGSLAPLQSTPFVPLQQQQQPLQGSRAPMQSQLLVGRRPAPINPFRSR